MNNWLKNFLTFNKSERNGMIILLIAIMLIILSPYYLKSCIKKQKTDFSSFSNEITAFEYQRKKYNDSVAHPKEAQDFNFNDVDRSIAESHLHPFPFNPNNLPVEKWRKLGLSDRQIHTIKNYEAKGGKFYKKEDLQKMYSISQDEYLILEPFIIIPEPAYKREQKITTISYPKAPPVMVEINSADSTELTKLNGIGPAFSRRIIKYRNLLGGYTSAAQLFEVYGMDSARLIPILGNITIDRQLVKKINLNSAALKDLSRHPYLDFYIAKAIINYRNKHGKFKTIEDLKNTNLIYVELFEKIKPYLTIE